MKLIPDFDQNDDIISPYERAYQKHTSKFAKDASDKTASNPVRVDRPALPGDAVPASAEVRTGKGPAKVIQPVRSHFDSQVSTTTKSQSTKEVSSSKPSLKSHIKSSKSSSNEDNANNEESEEKDVSSDEKDKKEFSESQDKVASKETTPSSYKQPEKESEQSDPSKHPFYDWLSGMKLFG